MKRVWLVAAALVLWGANGFAQSEGPPGRDVGGQPAVRKTAPAEPGYEIRMRELQEKVGELKSRIFDSKTRLMILGEQILNNLITEARAVIYHVNDASSMLTLEEVLYFLDNSKIYYQSNTDGALDRQKEFQVYNGSITPGNHILTVEMVYRGNGKLFTYLSGYVFRLKSSFSFFAAKGHETRVRAVGYEKGGLAMRLEDRPSIKFEMERVKVSSGSPLEGDAGDSKAGAGGGSK